MSNANALSSTWGYDLTIEEGGAYLSVSPEDDRTIQAKGGLVFSFQKLNYPSENEQDTFLDGNVGLIDRIIQGMSYTEARPDPVLAEDAQAAAEELRQIVDGTVFDDEVAGVVDAESLSGVDVFAEGIAGDAEDFPRDEDGDVDIDGLIERIAETERESLGVDRVEIDWDYMRKMVKGGLRSLGLTGK